MGIIIDLSCHCGGDEAFAHPQEDAGSLHVGPKNPTVQSEWGSIIHPTGFFHDTNGGYYATPAPGMGFLGPMEGAVGAAVLKENSKAISCQITDS